VWWLWVLGGLTVWLLVGTLFAVVVGRGIRLADQRSAGTGVLPVSLTPVENAKRGWVPLPAVGLALVLIALALETSGFVLRLTDATGPVARALSMDAPFSVPRLFVAALFAAAAVAAVVGAQAQHGRRTWWLAVALVAGGISVVKAGSTVHAYALGAAISAVGAPAALAVSVLLAVGVVVGLWFLSRNERRDRRRVLAALSSYAVAVVGLSALSSYAGAMGSSWATAATFVEESGEALAGVSFLMAVLIGVVPQAVLPRAWALRRTSDAVGVEIGRPAGRAVRR
jgi:hypothetical protein